MDLVALGTNVRETILAFARLITVDYWPGLISLSLFIVFVVLAVRMVAITIGRKQLLDRLSARIRKSGDAAGFQNELNDIEGELNSRKSSNSRRLASAFSEFRETLLEPSRNGGANVRNAFRPATFLNLEDLRFGLSGWRVWPGLFVSVGLLLTFLGLIAALANTKQSIAVGGGDQQKMMLALEGLLDTASAKFTMSLTGLACSIMFTALHRFCSSRLEHAISDLNHEIERRMDFISLEGIADRQLAAIKEQTAQQQLLNTQLIAELSKPLERMSATGVEAMGTMASELGTSLTATISASLDRVADRVDGAAATLNTLSTALGDASKRFEETLERSVGGLHIVVQRIELVTNRLSETAESVASTATPVMETVKSTAQAARALADGSVELIGAAKTAVDAERAIVVSAARSIEELIRAFEGRAKAYDGQLDKAFATYLEQVQRTLHELNSHSDGVHKRYANALEVLQGVIENARAFRPETASPETEPPEDESAEFETPEPVE